MDFAHLQVWAERALRHDDIAAAVGGSTGYLMVDEYQDVSRVRWEFSSVWPEPTATLPWWATTTRRSTGSGAPALPAFWNSRAGSPAAGCSGLTTNYRCHRDIVASQAGGWTPPHHGSSRAGYSATPRTSCPMRRRPTRSTRRHLGTGPGPRGRGRTARGPAPVPERQRRNHQLRPGGAAAPQREGRRQQPVPGRPGACRNTRPLRPAGQVRVPAGDEVLVTTIHQGKGLEWDLVVIGSLCGPEMVSDRIGRNLADCGVYSGEPESLIGKFDRARAHYVAFTRARRLLVLTASGEPQARFGSIWDEAARWPEVDPGRSWPPAVRH